MTTKTNFKPGKSTFGADYSRPDSKPSQTYHKPLPTNNLSKNLIQITEEYALSEDLFDRFKGGTLVNNVLLSPLGDEAVFFYKSTRYNKEVNRYDHVCLSDHSDAFGLHGTTLMYDREGQTYTFISRKTSKNPFQGKVVLNDGVASLVEDNFGREQNVRIISDVEPLPKSWGQELEKRFN